MKSLSKTSTDSSTKNTRETEFQALMKAVQGTNVLAPIPEKTVKKYRIKEDHLQFQKNQTLWVRTEDSLEKTVSLEIDGNYFTASLSKNFLEWMEEIEPNTFECIQDNIYYSAGTILIEDKYGYFSKEQSSEWNHWLDSSVVERYPKYFKKIGGFTPPVILPTHIPI